MKRRIQAWIIGLLLALIALPAYAATFDVTAKGRDEAVARTNAGVNAVRDCMQSLAPEAFLRANMETVRKQVILQSARYVRTITVHSQQQQGSLVVLTASVDVDAQALADTLAAMNMDDASKQSMATALAGMEPAAPAQAPAVAEAAVQSVAQAPAAPAAPAPSASDNAEAPVSIMGGTAVAVPMPDSPAAANGNGVAPVPGQANTPIAPDDKAYVRGNDATGMDAYIDDMRTQLANVIPMEALPVFLDADDQAMVRTLLGMNIRDIHMRVDEKGHITMLFTPADVAQMQATLVEGKTKQELFSMLGIAVQDMPQNAQKNLDHPLENVRHEKFTILKVQGEDFFCSQSGTRVVSGDHLPNIVETLTMLEEGLTPFAVEGSAPLRVCARKAMDTTEGIEKIFVEMQPAPGGSVISFRSDMGKDLAGLNAVRPMNLADLLVCDNNPPFFLMGLGNGLHLSALLDELQNDEILNPAVCEAMKKLDSVLLGIGGGQLVAPPLRIPVVTLGIKGAPEALQIIAGLAAAACPGQDSPVAGWEKVTTYPLQPLIRMPFNLVMAQRGNILAGGLLDIQNFSKPSKDVRTVLNAALEGSELTLPDAISSVILFNMRQCWQEIYALLDDPTMGAMVEMARPGTRAVLQQFFATTPPVTSIVGWSNSPNAAAGVVYIAMTKEDTTAFYQALKNLIEFFDKN
ncbi:MAG TPA: hypothetical protein IAB01_06910 [Candidatus Avidesulfovibrio excrementigallinarum]|nr:hypothetical protein [Candidatus Avidesulfovibrio excrementigallinarum]